MEILATTREAPECLKHGADLGDGSIVDDVTAAVLCQLELISNLRLDVDK